MKVKVFFAKELPLRREIRVRMCVGVFFWLCDVRLRVVPYGGRQSDALR